MQQTIFGKTDLSVSRLGFGSAPIGYLHKEAQQLKRVLGYLLDQGVNVVDTAACYPGSEEALGQTVSDRRDDFVLISKCGHAGDIDGEDFTAPVVTASIDRSLRRLKTDHLDVCLLHSCGLDVLQKGDALAALIEAREAGKVRFVGYSGDNEAAAWAAAQPDIAAIETSVNICDQVNIDMVLPVCKKHDVGVIAKRPIANAAWKQPDLQEGVYKNYASEYHRRFKLMGLTPRELGYSGHPEVEWPEIALKFTLGVGGVHTAICGTTSESNAESNVAAAKKNPLREEVVTKIRDAFAAARDEDSEGDWTGKT